MAHKAPGRGVQKEPVCYNCGTAGHWVVACPEPTRDVPAGLRRWQSQHQDQAQAPEKPNQGPDKKGPTVTQFQPPRSLGPPPPPPPPPPLPFGAPPLSSYPAPPPPGPPPLSYPAYQPAPTYAPHYPRSAQPHYQHFAAGPPPASLPPQPPPHFSQQPTPSYGQPPHPPPPYPQPGYYPPPPPPNYHPGTYQQPPYAPPPGYPPSNYPPSEYPPSEYSPPGYHPSGHPTPSYPPSGYAPQPYPTPPAAYPPPGPYPPVSGPSHLPTPPPGPGPQWQSNGRNNGSKGPRPPNFQSSRQRRGKHRDKRNGPRRPANNTDDHKQQLPYDRTAASESHHGRRSRSQSPHSRPDSAMDAAGGPDGMKSPKPPEEPVASDDGWDEKWQREFDRTFPEPKVKAADPVGIPLPEEYTDKPTIPPAYNASSIKSVFFREDDAAGFAKSIRQSPRWSAVRRDPAFKSYLGMVPKRFSDSPHEYYTYETPPRHPPSAPIKLPPRIRIDRSAWDELKDPRVPGRIDLHLNQGKPQDSRDWGGRDPPRAPRNFGKRTFEERRPMNDRADRGDHRVKRPKLDSSRPTTPPTPNGQSFLQAPSPGNPGVSNGTWSPLPGESVSGAYDPLGKPYAQQQLPESSGNIDVSPRDEQGRRPCRSNFRHDSGYHSGQSQDMPAPTHGRESGDGRSSRSPRGGRKSRLSSEERGHRSPSRSRSRSRNRSSSPLTALEAELLGLSHPSQSRNTTEPAPNKRRVRPVKVASAFSRRW